MKTTYLVTFNHIWTGSDKIIKAIESTGTDKNWLLVWEGAVLVQGFDSIHDLNNLIHAILPKCHFLVSQVFLAVTTVGWMSDTVWEFISDKPKSPPPFSS